MKPVFKCDYCSHMGTEEDVREHEINCPSNYDRKNCNTCMHKRTYIDHNIGLDKANPYYTCEKGKEIPKGQMYEFCPEYERNVNTNIFNDLFGSIFGNSPFK